MNPAALSIDDLASLLSRVGEQPVSPAKIREHVEAGAPRNEDGTLHLVHYTAWLARQTN